MKELNIKDNEVLAFDVFNPKCDTTNEEKNKKLETLLNFYGACQESTFLGNVNVAPPLFEVTERALFSIPDFLADFQKALKIVEAIRNKEIIDVIKKGEISTSNVDQYKAENPISQDQIYSEMFRDYDVYPEIMQIFKLSLLIPPSTANVERSFSVLNLIHTKQRNKLSVKHLNQLMRIVINGSPKLEESEIELLVDKYRDAKPRRIEL